MTIKNYIKVCVIIQSIYWIYIRTTIYCCGCAMSLTLILTMVNGMTLAHIDDRVTMICVGQNLTLKVEVEIIEIL